MHSLELYVTEHDVSVLYRGRTVARFYVENNTICRQNFTDDLIVDVQSLSMTPDTIKVEVITLDYPPQESVVSLPNTRRRAATTETIHPRKKNGAKITHTQDADTITDAESSRILREILLSEHRLPNQSKTQRAAETHRIAEKVGVRPMAVAGVRANMTRGAYGNPRTLKASFANKLKKR